MTNIHKRTNR